jgi:hypothetical protein
MWCSWRLSVDAHRGTPVCLHHQQQQPIKPAMYANLSGKQMLSNVLQVVTPWHRQFILGTAGFAKPNCMSCSPIHPYLC